MRQTHITSHPEHGVVLRASLHQPLAPDMVSFFVPLQPKINPQTWCRFSCLSSPTTSPRHGVAFRACPAKKSIPQTWCRFSCLSSPTTSPRHGVVFHASLHQPLAPDMVSLFVPLQPKLQTPDMVPLFVPLFTNPET